MASGFETEDHMEDLGEDEEYGQAGSHPIQMPREEASRASNQGPKRIWAAKTLGFSFLKDIVGRTSLRI